MSIDRLVERIRTEVNSRSWLRLGRGAMRRAARYYRYSRLCGPVPAGGYVLAERRGDNGLISVEVPALGRTIRLRLGSTDISVAGKILLEREYELPLSRDPAIIVDAGAYIGLSSLWFAARYPDATVVALEPDASNFELLLSNVAGVEKIIPLREALWSEDGFLRVIDAGNGAWGYRVDVDGVGDSVPATSVQTLMRKLGLDRINLLKVDIEGSELVLFSDATAWLSRVDAIAVETHDDFRAGARRAVMTACTEFLSTDVGHETILLQRVSASPSPARE